MHDSEYFYLPDIIQKTMREERDIFKYIELDKQRLSSSVKIPSYDHRKEFLRAFGLFSFPLFDDILFKSAAHKNLQEDLDLIKSKMQRINKEFNERRLNGHHLVLDLLRAEENRVAHNFAQKMEDQHTTEIFTQPHKRRKVYKETDHFIAHLHIIPDEQKNSNNIKKCKVYLKNEE